MRLIVSWDDYMVAVTERDLRESILNRYKDLFRYLALPPDMVKLDIDKIDSKKFLVNLSLQSFLSKEKSKEFMRRWIGKDDTVGLTAFYFDMSDHKDDSEKEITDYVLEHIPEDAKRHCKVDRDESFSRTWAGGKGVKINVTGTIDTVDVLKIITLSWFDGMDIDGISFVRWYKGWYTEEKENA